MTADRTEDTETGMKRKIENLLTVNGHKPQLIEGTDTGWVRCTECAGTARGSSDGYWSRVSCNRNQGATTDCWSRKRYTILAGKTTRRDEHIRNMPAGIR